MRSPERARRLARFTTVVVFPTPPFWFAQAIVRPTQRSARTGFTEVDFTIERVFTSGRAVQEHREQRAAFLPPPAATMTHPAYRWLIDCSPLALVFHVKQLIVAPLPVPAARGILRRDVAAVLVAINEPGRWARDLSGRSAEETTRPMTLLLAAVGAVVTALVELTVVPYLQIGSAHPHPVLVLAVIVTIAIGVEAGLVWAFVGGLALDVLAHRPLGSSAFALLIAVGGTAILARGLAQLRPIVPIVARQAAGMRRISPLGSVIWAQSASRAMSVAPAPAERQRAPPLPGCISMLWIVIPSGIFRSGRQFPTAGGAFSPLWSSSPAFKP